MSHSKEREEKNCLNCNAVVHGRYCGICGQENLEPQETVGHLASHFFNDITHFDGKFFGTMKWLIRKPGFLTQEYVAGRRGSYLNPVRMYVFTSAIFFLIYFSFFATGDSVTPPKPAFNRADSFHIKVGYASAGIDTSILPFSASKTDSFYIKTALASIGVDTSKKISYPPKKTKKANSGDFNVGGESLSETSYRDRKQYDSLIDAGGVKHSFWRRMVEYKKLSLKEKYGTDKKRMNEQLEENIRHNIPYMFFLSLPLVALFLKLLYIRRKQFYYVAHAIFILHVYIFIYIAVLVMLIIDALSDLAYMDWLTYSFFILIPLTFLYPYRAMRNFYGQGRGKTILKFALLLIWFTFIIIFLLAGLFFFSILKL